MRFQRVTNLKQLKQNLKITFKVRTLFSGKKSKSRDREQPNKLNNQNIIFTLSKR